MRKTIILSSIILSIGLLLVLTCDYNFKLHKELSTTFHVKILGALVFTWTLTVLMITLKRIHRRQPAIALTNLTLIGALIAILAQVINQFARQFTFIALAFSDRMVMFLQDLSIMSLYGLIISFLISYQLKTKNTPRFISYITVILLCNYLIQKYFISLY